jgi:flagellar assembly factor FliW
MLVQTTRFGPVDVDETRLLEFPAGLLGFSRARKFALLQPDERGVFFWLQSVESADVAFVVTDPGLWCKDFSVTLRREQAAEIGLPEGVAPQLLVIVNRRDHGITANMQGPLVIHPATRVGLQVVLADRRWTTRHELVSVAPATTPTAAQPA